MLANGFDPQKPFAGCAGMEAYAAKWKDVQLAELLVTHGVCESSPVVLEDSETDSDAGQTAEELWLNGKSGKGDGMEEENEALHDSGIDMGGSNGCGRDIAAVQW
jgi:hypothetical protein